MLQQRTAVSTPVLRPPVSSEGIASGGKIGSNQWEWLNNPTAVLGSGVDLRRSKDYPQWLLGIDSTKRDVSSALVFFSARTRRLFRLPAK